MDVNRNANVVRGDTHLLQRAEHGTKLRQGTAALAHQLIGGHAGVRVGMGEIARHLQHPPAHLLFDPAPFAFALDAFARLLHTLDAQRGREHGRAVLVAARELRLLQPGDGGTHAVVVGGAIAFELAAAVLDQDLAGGGHYRVFGCLTMACPPPVETAQRAQHRLDVAPFEPGSAR